MKKFLLFAAAALMVATAGAQLKAPAVHSKAAIAKEKLSQLPSQQKLNLSEISTVKEMKAEKNMIKEVTPKAPKKAGYLEPFYKRPAGMFYSPFIASNGVGFYSYGYNGFLIAKPFADYTWDGTISGGVDENTHASWDVFIRDETYYVDDVEDIYYNSYWWFDDAPIFYAVDGELEDQSAVWYDYQMKTYETEENIGGGVTVKNEMPVQIITADNDETLAIMLGEEGVEFMCSSKSMVWGGRNADQAGLLSRYYGADPVEGNEYGWWFGKNASHVDGIGQMFEKPEHPYLLKKVYFQANEDMVVNAPVRLTCKVYKLDEIPAYIDSGNVVLPEIPGELLVTGEGTVTPTTGEDRNGLITFTLYGQDEFDPTLTYEYAPTIDFPIMVVVDGYNDPDKSDIVDISAFICVDDQVDEGYGELAYMKEGIYEIEYNEQGDTIFDEDGNPKTYFTGEYRWRGMNNRFSGGTLKMMSGFTVFIGVEHPFITFNYGLEDGEYTFPREGGKLVKNFEYSDGVVTSEGIEFFSQTPSEDGDWWMTWNGEEELPDWLEINLSDDYDEEGNFSGLVIADVTAAPLPEGMDYREAIIRFEIPGAYIDYKFMQGEKVVPIYPEGDVNGDGEVNIADVNCVIGVIQGGEDTYEGRADVNKDGEVNIGDVNAIIAIILS